MLVPSVLYLEFCSFWLGFASPIVFRFCSNIFKHNALFFAYKAAWDNSMIDMLWMKLIFQMLSFFIYSVDQNLIIIRGEFEIYKSCGKTKTKTFWLSHLNEYPELLCGLCCDYSWSQTIPMGNSHRGRKENFRASL